MPPSALGAAKLPDDPWSLPLGEIDPSRPELFQSGAHHAYFRRLRREDPVHLTKTTAFGPFWSVTRFDDIVAVDSNHEMFSAGDGVSIADKPGRFRPPMFIAMDGQQHADQRKAASPGVAPGRLAVLEDLVRERVRAILDALPRGETFDWVERVSKELTAQMLATLFDFPWEDRHLLPYWSDVVIGKDAFGETGADVEQERVRVLGECLAYFTDLWRARAAAPPAMDFLSLLAHSPATRGMVDDPDAFLGTLMLLITGGNDTTRNSISGGIVAINQYPDELVKVRADPALLPGLVSEIIRWQTPVAHMRRVARGDVELGGKRIKKGDHVIMWYVSGNRDEDVIERPDELIVDRGRVRHHVAFGYGVHRCMGNRMAELQLRVVWEEILPRFERIELMGEPVRMRSNTIQGIVELPVRIPA